MSFLSDLEHFTNNVGRGTLDLFTLGGNELGHKFGGDWYQKLMRPVETGFGANFEAGATGGSTILGAQGLSALGSAGGGVGGMSPYMPTSAPNMGAAGSTLGAGGTGSPLNLMSSGSGAASGPSPTSHILQMMRLGKMFGGQQQQQPQAPAQGPTDKLKALYTMFPGLRPGANMQSPNFGGQYGA